MAGSGPAAAAAAAAGTATLAAPARGEITARDLASVQGGFTGLYSAPPLL